MVCISSLTTSSSDCSSCSNYKHPHSHTPTCHAFCSTLFPSVDFLRLSQQSSRRHSSLSSEFVASSPVGSNSGCTLELTRSLLKNSDSFLPPQISQMGTSRYCLFLVAQLNPSNKPSMCPGPAIGSHSSSF